MAARGLLTRGPPSAEPSEAHAKGVPVGKRTVLEVQEKVAPRRAGYSGSSWWRYGGQNAGTIARTCNDRHALFDLAAYPWLSALAYDYLLDSELVTELVSA